MIPEQNPEPGGVDCNGTGRLEALFAKRKLILFIYTSFFGIGVLWHALPLTYPIMRFITPWVLLIFGVFIFLSAVPEGGKRLLLWGAGTYLVTFIIEAIGVATGKVFGVYIYGDVLGFKLLEVPLLIGFNWTVVILGLASFVTRYIKNRILAAPLIALGAVLFDMIMEPIAMALDYWHWSNGVIPIQNYVAWFVIGLAAAAGYIIAGIRVRTPYPAFYVSLQMVFFGALYFVVL